MERKLYVRLWSPSLLRAPAPRACLGRVDDGSHRYRRLQHAQTPWAHHRWGKSYLWAYTVVFLTATLLSVQHWSTDAYLFFLALTGYGFALGGYATRCFRQQRWLRYLVGKQWVIPHIVGMIGSYIVLWTAFFVDNAHFFPGLNRLPSITFWVLPTVVAIPFLVLSLSRFAPKTLAWFSFSGTGNGKGSNAKKN
jgi:hypothetical protein